MCPVDIACSLYNEELLRISEYHIEVIIQFGHLLLKGNKRTGNIVFLGLLQSMQFIVYICEQG